MDIHERALEKAKQYKKCEAELLDIIQEIDEKKLYLEKGFTNPYDYCVRLLNLSESNSYAFVQIARKAKLVPQLKEAIHEQKLTLSKAHRIVSVITQDNQDHWLE